MNRLKWSLFILLIFLLFKTYIMCEVVDNGGHSVESGVGVV